jgi:hypothetical protein
MSPRLSGGQVSQSVKNWVEHTIRGLEPIIGLARGSTGPREKTKRHMAENAIIRRYVVLVRSEGSERLTVFRTTKNLAEAIRFRDMAIDCNKCSVARVFDGPIQITELERSRNVSN